MLLKRNLLETLTSFCCGGSLICILLHYVTNISPITGIWFPIYVIFLFILSLSCSFKFLQWLLVLNKPLKYDLDTLVKQCPYLKFLGSIFPKLPKSTRHHKSREYKEYDTNELSVISTVLERKLVSSWYMPYISEEIGFPFACKQLLDQMIGKAFQICNKIETKDLCIDVCTVLTIHLREYKKAVKRHEKSPTSSIESLYKATPDEDYAKRLESSEHCYNVLRIIFKELVPWELWDTPHSDLLIRILAKKLDILIDTTIADPVWLNDKLLTYLCDKEIETEDQEQEDFLQPELPIEIGVFTNEQTCYGDIVIEEQHYPEQTLDAALPSSSISPKPMISDDFAEEGIESTIDGEQMGDFVEVNGSNPIEIQSSPVLRQRRGRQGKSEVKIYDRIIEGSVKTWDTDMDLQCISLGQDLLASLDGEMTLSRLWGTEEPETSPRPPAEPPQPLWFGEEDVTEDPEPQTSPSKKETSPKPAEIILKELQGTVREAKSKMGDLQDEAAGMMEGLLDFGIAGLKKGLRFTGLSDDSQDKEKSPMGAREKEKHGSSGSGTSPPLEDQGTTSLLQKEDNGFVNNVPPLVKQHRVISQDSVPYLPRPLPQVSQPEPAPLPPQPVPPTTSGGWTGGESPEPQYEEAADLSTSIAKLRTLLRQSDHFQNRNDESNIWWETAEETRGRAHPHHSTRPVDTATLADEYDMQTDRNTSPNQSSNNMQRLDKLFQRTVTGVFNSIRTAVGAEGDEPAGPRAPPADLDWQYVCTSIEMSVGGAVARLVGSRRAYSHVDAALDSLEQLSAPPAPADTLPPDDLEEWCSSEGACYSACAELTRAAGLTRSHTATRLATVLLAELIESLIAAWLDELTAWLKRELFATFERMSNEAPHYGERVAPRRREFHVDETCAVVMGKLPAGLLVFGEETLSEAVRLSVTSLSHPKLNRQLAGRLLAHAAVHWKNM